MKRSIRIILFLTIIFGVPGVAPQEPVRDLITGHEWGKLSHSVKKGYMMGFEEGLMIAQTAVIIERKEIAKGSANADLLDRIENWIDAYKLGFSSLDRKVEMADDVFKKKNYQTIMAAAVLPLVSKRVMGEISAEEMTEKLEQLLNVLKNE